MRFSDICLVTRDVPRLKAFYEAVFGKPAEGDDRHAGIALDGLTLVFDSLDMLKEGDPFSYVSGDSSDNLILSFNVPDVDAEHEKIRALGAPILCAPTTHPWGARSFQFRDPDGNILNFRTPGR